MGSAASFAKAAQDASDVQIRAALGDLSPEDLAKVHQVQLGGNCGGSLQRRRPHNSEYFRLNFANC